MSNEEEFSWEQLKPLYGEIFSQIIENPLFVEFFACHFDLNIHVNEEEQAVEVSVVSLPEQETTNRMMAVAKRKLEDSPRIYGADSKLVY